MSDSPRIICISNRLAVNAVEDAEKIVFHPSSGGLVTAIEPILEKSRGAWIGWPGAAQSSTERISAALAEFSTSAEFDLFPVFLNKQSIEGFYYGFSNQIIWPLFHDLQSRCNFDPQFWADYLQVQELFCEETVKHIRPNDLIWVHDYHLIGLAQSLRKKEIKNKICFFLHTPFPGPDIFLKLPWREDVLQSLIQYDLLGFQTTRDLNNFINCLSQLTGIKASTRGSQFAAQTKDRECIIGAFPISIDSNEFEAIAQLPEVQERAQKIRSDMGVQHIVLSIDRLDYTKGIPYRIRAFKKFLELHPEFKKQVALLQVVVPSRIEVPEYQQLQAEIEQLVSQVNGTLGEPGWVPVHHLFRSLTREEVIAFYRGSDVALVTPLKDGMNLVAKEYCVSRLDNRGTLILSEFAGAADELGKGALLVNPCNIEDVANSIHRAISSSEAEIGQRMQLLRETIRHADVFNWASTFLQAAGWEWASHDSAPMPKAANIWERLRRITNVFDI